MDSNLAFDSEKVFQNIKRTTMMVAEQNAFEHLKEELKKGINSEKTGLYTEEEVIKKLGLDL